MNCYFFNPSGGSPLDYFNHRQEDYSKYRPSYPVLAIDTILSHLNFPLTVADIGAGTGIGARLLAREGIKVIAVEPNSQMRSAATAHPQVEFLAGTAENIPLSTATIDLVTAFQSFHWFDFAQSLKEFARILKPEGRLALVWNFWDSNDPISKEYSYLVLTSSLYQQSSKFFSSWLRKIRYQLFWQGLWLPNFTNLQKYQFSFQQNLDLIGLVGLADSQGFTPSQGEDWEKLVSRLSEFHGTWKNSQGEVTITYRTYLYLAKPINIYH